MEEYSDTEIVTKVPDLEYDKSIHSNPDAKAWAKFYQEINPGCDLELMIGWFANAMMAMHDYLYQTKISKMEKELEEIKKIGTIIEILRNVRR